VAWSAPKIELAYPLILLLLVADIGANRFLISLLERALKARERVLGRDHPDTLTTVNILAELYQLQVRYAEAGPLYQRALEARERVLGRDHPDTLTTVNNLAELYRLQGRYAEAGPLYQRALEARERVLGRDHPNTLSSVNNLALLYRAQGRYSEVEPLYQRALEANERVLGREHPNTLTAVNNLAVLYKTQGRYAEAEPLHQRALEACERVLGRDHPNTLSSINLLAELYGAQGRYAEAEPLHQRALEVSERVLGRDHPDTLLSVNNLAGLYWAQGRYAEAHPLFRRALEDSERVLGREHPDTLPIINNLAALYRVQGRYTEAEALYSRTLEVRERVLGREHPDTLMSVNNLAALYFIQRDWSRAAEFWRRSTAGIAARTRRGALVTGVTGNKKGESQQLSWQFRGHVKAVYRLAQQGRSPDAATSFEMFQTAQWALSSEAAQSLAQMAARSAKGNGAIARLVRERQDLVAEWQRLETWRNRALGHVAAKRDAKAEAENVARLDAIVARISEIDKRLALEFPDYASLASPTPLTVADVQAQLGADEALVLFLDTSEWKPTSEETFIWVVTRTDIRWVGSELGTAALTRDVQALRCGLDANAWEGPQCAGLTGTAYSEADANAGKPLPFSLVRAHGLYKSLFGQVEEVIKGKHLLIVPSGPLTQLPFQVLVTTTPAKNDYESAAWLARDHAITILPAVSSLKALRGIAHPSIATKPMIGFGNPLLDGPQNHPRFGAYYKKQAQLAHDNQHCHETAFQRVAALFGLRGVTPVEIRGGLAQVSHIKMQAPLPETTDELCAVAHALKTDTGELRLGASATEHEVKALNASGQLAQYRIVHFATHAALAGELEGASEPGLILTPPDTATEDDDGYLSASEIAGLKLDADWVILSACNTAAGDAKSAQALSGLARAFIYAQARALLVSHWSVDSAATVKLITTAMREMASDAKVGRAEALRRSMLALINKAEPKNAHPSYWAPFIVVGEGGR
jgi:CHAT domain-containing protein/tetratricopeptide (TPR) repeat protein